ncbi:MAG: helix-turn-helix domain-containing protein [Gemmatimonadaceae bacterium]|nr:helix-turn-helix domain-containing protein [Gemmatimonadaceae bacterium]
MSGSHSDIESLLSEVHDHLDDRVTLATLAQRSGYSPFHFHRSFVETVGETPKQHILRMRLERAAYLLAVTDDGVLRLALSVGFSSHETFTRAFRRHFDMSPTAYRIAARKAQAERLEQNEHFTGDGCHLSAVTLCSLPSTMLLCSRHTGAYAEMRLPPYGPADHLWAQLSEWADSVGAAHERTAWVICLDDPTLTPGPQQRLDACVQLLTTSVPHGPFTVREFAGGWYAATEHVGPHETIIQAYRHVADGIRRSAKLAFGSGPPVQIFRYLDRDPAYHRTEVYFPVVRR